MGPSSSSNAVRPRLFAVTDALVIAQEALAWSRGLQRIVLTVQTANPEALKFYQRHGKTAPPLQPGRCCILYHTAWALHALPADLNVRGGGCGGL